MDTACRQNDRRSSDKESRCVPRGRREENESKTAIEMGGLREKIRQERRRRRKLERKSARQKRMEAISSKGDRYHVIHPSPLNKGMHAE